MSRPSSLTVVYLSDQRFYYDACGNWFTTASFPLPELVKAFPSGLRRWIFFGRLLPLPADRVGFFPIELPQDVSVEFQGPRFPVSGLAGFLLHFPKYWAMVRSCTGEADIIWAKLSYVATLLALHRKLTSAFVVTHMVGDPGDTFEIRGGLFWKLFAGLCRWLNQRALKNADVCLFVSRALQERYGFPDQVNAAIHEGRISRAFLVPRFSQDTKMSDTVLYVGRLSKEKGVDVLIAAFALAAEKVDIRLRIVGDGQEMEQLQQLSKLLGVDGKITFAGKITWGEQLFSEMRGATCLVLPSFTEGFGLVLQESLGQGTPVIASDVGGVREALGTEEAGILVPAGDRAALASAIVRLVTDRDLQERLVENGLRHVTQNTLECQVERLRQIFTVEFAKKSQAAKEDGEMI